jgi:asparagine synthetase B (glutamine-hydrolysing)
VLIDCAGVELEIIEGPVGIMASGGVDSSILLYYLMKNATGTIHIYTTGSNQKFRRNSIIAPMVVEKCIQLTGNNNVVHHIHYDEAATDSSMCDAPKNDVFLTLTTLGKMTAIMSSITTMIIFICRGRTQTSKA